MIYGLCNTRRVIVTCILDSLFVLSELLYILCIIHFFFYLQYITIIYSATFKSELKSSYECRNNIKLGIQHFSVFHQLRLHLRHSISPFSEVNLFARKRKHDRIGYCLRLTQLVPDERKRNFRLAVIPIMAERLCIFDRGVSEKSRYTQE